MTFLCLADPQQQYGMMAVPLLRFRIRRQMSLAVPHPATWLLLPKPLHPPTCSACTPAPSPTCRRPKARVVLVRFCARALLQQLYRRDFVEGASPGGWVDEWMGGWVGDSGCSWDREMGSCRHPPRSLRPMGGW